MSAVHQSHDQQSVRPRQSASRVLAVCSLLALGCGGGEAPSDGGVDSGNVDSGDVDSGNEQPCGEGTFLDSSTGECVPWTPCEEGFIPSPAGTSTSDQGCIEQPWEWATQYGPATGARGGSLTVLADGTSVDVGWTDASFIGFTNAGRTDIYVRAIDPNGLVLWTDQFGSEGWDIGYAVASDAAGAIYVVGNVAGTLPGQTSSGYTDGFLRKYDANGVVLWTRQFGTEGSENASAVAVDALGNVIVGGHTLYNFGGAIEAFVHQYDPDGNEIWTRQSIGEEGEDQFAALAITGDSHIYAVGTRTVGDLGWGGDVDVLVRKYDSDGVEVWTRTLGSSQPDYPHDVAVDDVGNLIVVGETEGGLPGQTDQPGVESFIWKWDPSGASLSGTQFSGGYFGAADAVAVDALGRVYVGGRTVEPLEYRASVYLRLYSSSGDLLWSREFGSPGNNAFRDIGFDGAGLVYVSGSTADGLPGEVTTSESDRFIMRLRSIDL